jgi:ABC-type phosphate transport system substrate-binding protein
VRTTTKTKIGIAGLGVFALSIVASVPAFGDYAPSASDIVGVGGDTPQFDLQFGSDGSPFGNGGYNGPGSINKLVTFNATADGNARNAYVSGTSTNLNPTDVLRAGTFPVQRTQSSGDGINALLADTGAQETINFAFSASLPSTTQQGQANTNGWGFLHVVQLGTDSVQIAANTTTNAPPALSAADLLSIYTGSVTKWNQLPNNAGASSDTIIPLIPPTSSSIYKTLIADLTTANGGNAPTLSSAVKTVEQNDPSAITGASTPVDAIAPFSSARLKLWSEGYFFNPGTKFPGATTPLQPGIKLLSGTPLDGTAYNTPITHYVIFRQSDANSTTPFQPGGTRNWVQTLFSNPGTGASKPYFNTPAGLADISDAGTTPSYSDLGNVHS